MAETLTVRVGQELTIEELARLVDDAIYDHDKILEFVIALDLLVADYDFTQQLRDALSAALAAEDAAEAAATVVA